MAPSSRFTRLAFEAISKPRENCCQAVGRSPRENCCQAVGRSPRENCCQAVGRSPRDRRREANFGKITTVTAAFACAAVAALAGVASAASDTKYYKDTDGVKRYYTVESASSKTASLVGDSYGHSYCNPAPTGETHKISSKVGNYTVVALGSGALTNLTSLKKVILPNKITTIKARAIVGCTALETISISSAVTFKQNAIVNCPALTNFTIAAEGTGLVAEGGVLYKADKTTLVHCPPGLKAITIPESVTAFEQFAFDDAALTSLHLPAALESIGITPLQYAPNITAYSVSPDSATYSTRDGALYDKAGTTLKRWPSARTSCVLPEGVTNIAQNAFDGCTRLADVAFPRSLARIENYAFRNVPTLATLSFNGDVPENFIGKDIQTCGGLSNTECKKITLRYRSAFAANWEAALATSTYITFGTTEVLPLSGFFIIYE